MGLLVCRNGLSPGGSGATQFSSERYIAMLNDVDLAREGQRLRSDVWFFQQDSATCHTAARTRNWLEQQAIQLLEWPVLSPGLNPKENLWGWMARQVYKDGSSFNDKASLRKAIFAAWQSIPEDLLRSLIYSMPQRIFEVIC